MHAHSVSFRPRFPRANLLYSYEMFLLPIQGEKWLEHMTLRVLPQAGLSARIHQLRLAELHPKSQLKHKTKNFLLRSIEPFNLQRERFLQLGSHEVQEWLIGFLFL